MELHCNRVPWNRGGSSGSKQAALPQPATDLQTSYIQPGAAPTNAMKNVKPANQSMQNGRAAARYNQSSTVQFGMHSHHNAHGRQPIPAWHCCLLTNRNNKRPACCTAIHSSNRNYGSACIMQMQAACVSNVFNSSHSNTPAHSGTDIIREWAGGQDDFHRQGSRHVPNCIEQPSLGHARLAPATTTSPPCHLSSHTLLSCLAPATITSPPCHLPSLTP